MKKFLICFLGIMLIQISISESVDLNNYTNDELMALHELIENELIERGLIGTQLLYPGIYYGGESIKVGCYMLTVENKSRVITYSEGGYYCLYDLLKGEMESIVVTIHEGDTLKIDEEYVHIEEFNNLFTP